MKKNKQSIKAKGTVKVQDKSSDSTVQTTADSLDEEERGFGGWLRSSDGLETMKLFVIANSIVMFTTLAYPHMQNVIGIVSDMIYGPDYMY